MFFKQNLLIFIVCCRSLAVIVVVVAANWNHNCCFVLGNNNNKKIADAAGAFFCCSSRTQTFPADTYKHTSIHAYVYVCVYLQYVVLATGFWSIILVSSGLQSAADKEWTHGAGAGAERGQAGSGRHLLLPATSCSRLQLATAKAAASANRKLYGAIAPKGSELVIFTFIAKLCIFLFAWCTWYMHAYIHNTYMQINT